MTRRALLVAGGLAVCAAAAGLLVASARTGGRYDDLLAVYKDLRALREPVVRDGVPDYAPSAIDARRRTLDALGERLRGIDPVSWPVPRKVDYLVTRTLWNTLDFEHRVLRPWIRDAGFYLDMVERLPYTELPVQPATLEAFRTRLAAVPAILEQAKTNLAEGSGEYARITIRDLEQDDGVGNRQPIDGVAVGGVMAWYARLAASLEQHHPDLAVPARAAQKAVDGFHAWLAGRESTMTAPAGVGADDFNWYLKHVRLMPFTASDLVDVGERELGRSLAFLAFERHRNNRLPPLDPAPSDADYQQRIADADRHVRAFIRDRRILTIPDHIGELETGVPFLVRPGGRRNFWEEVQYRDPLPDHVHAVIPGHRFDGQVSQRIPHPIRSTFSDAGRVEGWGFYLEEMMLMAGLLDERPRTRELFHIFNAGRAVRNRAEVQMHTGEWSMPQAVKYMVDNTPFMDEDVARVDCEIYLRRPTYGSAYLMGKVQIDRLVAERARQLGDGFSLLEFHDEFLAAGRIPVSLIRWEMTGRDDEVRALWPEGFAAPGTN